MHDFYVLLPDRLSEEFQEIDGDVAADLLHSNQKYAALKEELHRMEEQYSFIDRLMDGQEELSFSAQEHQALNEYFQLLEKLSGMEREQLYFKGHMDCFAYLQKIGAFKTE